MNKKLKCIMLIDDNPDDNFIHERVIKKNHAADMVISKHTAQDALQYLKSNQNCDMLPELIFLDINMPGMNGWEFLQEYDKLDIKSKCQLIVIMLTTSENQEDSLKTKNFNIVSAFRTKPLTKEILEGVIDKYFQASNS